MCLDPQPWMTAPETVALMAALGEARFVGGAVRNALLGVPINDVDVATPLSPAIVTQRLIEAGIRVVPTGLGHGTVTAIIGDKTFEITTLRRDVATDGRHAIVEFTTDWAEDAQRRDFTMNALYADVNGEVLDTVGGVDDLNARRLRFVGNAATRIREDYLRILRLFRFAAQYGFTPDKQSMHAVCDGLQGLPMLSGERIQKEMFKLLETRNPANMIREMAFAGVAGAIGLQRARYYALYRLQELEKLLGLSADPVLRLAALISPVDVEAVERLRGRWRLSNADARRLQVAIEPALTVPLYTAEPRQTLFRFGIDGFRERAMLTAARDANADLMIAAERIKATLAMECPVFPLTGADVLSLGAVTGPAVGDLLEVVQDWWIGSGFPSQEATLFRLKAEFLARQTTTIV